MRVCWSHRLTSRFSRPPLHAFMQHHHQLPPPSASSSPHTLPCRSSPARPKTRAQVSNRVYAGNTSIRGHACLSPCLLAIHAYHATAEDATCTFNQGMAPFAATPHTVVLTICPFTLFALSSFYNPNACAVIWGTTVNVDNSMNRFRRFLLEFTEEVSGHTHTPRTLYMSNTLQT